MPILRRTRDNAGYQGSSSEIIAWNDDGTVKSIKQGRPEVGCSVRVGTVTAGTFSNIDWWMTTEVTEIMEDTPDKVRFKTKNSEYVWQV